MSEWITVTWTEVMAGDHVRMVGAPESAAVVESITPDPWRGHSKTVWEKRVEDYPNGAQQWKHVVEPDEHVDVFVRLVGRDGLLKFAPDGAVELLADDTFHARRLAVMLDAFPTSTPVLPNPARDWNRS
jgi:hypothetical protein